MLPSRLQIGGWALLLLWGVVCALLSLDKGLVLLPLLGWVLFLAVAGWRLWRAPLAFSLERRGERVAGLNQPYVMCLRVQSLASQALHCSLYDHYPLHFQTDEMPITRVFAPMQGVEVVYRLLPKQRGEFCFAGVQLRYQSRFGLWIRAVFLPLTLQGKTYPLAAASSRQALESVREKAVGHSYQRWQQQGQGDFSHLRDYQAGDSLRHLDYKALARLARPMTKVFYHEQAQPVVLLLDQSRRMKGLFDEALQAAVLLAHGVLYQGDELRLQTFSADENHWLVLRRKSGMYGRLMEQLCSLQADDYPPNYVAACQRFYRRGTQKSLVILLTVLQAGDGEALRRSVRLLKRRHDVVVISLQPPYLYQPIVVNDLISAAAIGARDGYYQQFEATQKALKAERVAFFSCAPEHLRAQIINVYLRHKQQVS